MQETPYIWMDGTLVPWKDATVHVLTHSLHYGSAVFEGIRCYETPKGPAIFRLAEHIKRLIYSAAAMRMQLSFTQKQLEEACVEVVAKNTVKACYIRPLVYYGYGKMGLNPIGAPVRVSVACWPWGAYLGGDTVKVGVSSYRRIHPQTSVTDAKISGHYVNSIMASLEAHVDNDWGEALLLDYKGNVAEGPGENIFAVKGKKIITPKAGTILPGITRDSIMTILRDQGYDVAEKVVTLKDLHGADECFFTGTAAEVTGIASIDDRVIGKGDGELGPVTNMLREIYADVVRGRNATYEGWLTYVSA